MADTEQRLRTLERGVRVAADQLKRAVNDLRSIERIVVYRTEQVDLDRMGHDLQHAMRAIEKAIHELR